MTKARRWRWVIVAALVLPALELVYVAVVNGFLASPLAPLVLNLRPDVVSLTYDRIWTILPGRLHATNVYVRVDDGNVQVEVRADVAAMDINPFTLFTGVFSGSHVRGEGVYLRLRQRREAQELTPEKLAKLPPIEGFDAAPVFDDRRPLPDNYAKLIAVQLSDMDVKSVREIWVEEYRFVGELDVVGGFYVKPFGSARVDDVSADIKFGQLSLGDRLFADGLSGQVAASIPMFDLRGLDRRVLRGLNAHVGLVADITELGFINYYLTELPAVRLEQGAGALSLAIDIDSGSVRSGSKLALDSTALTLAFPHFTALTDGHVDWLAEAEGSSVLFEVGPFSLRQRSDNRRCLDGKALTVRAQTTNLDLANPIALTANVTLADVRTDSLNVLNNYLPKGLGLTVLSGSAALHGALRLASERQQVSGELELNGDRVSVRDNAHATTIAGQVRVRAKITSLDLDTYDTNLAGSSVVLNDVSIDQRGKHTQDFWARVSLDACRIVPKGRVMWDASVSVALKNLSPVIDVVSAVVAVPWIVQALSSLEDVKLSCDLRVGKRFVEMTQIAAEGGAVKVVGRLAIHDAGNGKQPAHQQADALMLLKIGGTTVGVDVVKNHPGVRLLDAQRWYDERKDQPFTGQAP